MTLPDGEVVKAAELSGADGLLFRRNSQTGAIEALPRSGRWGGPQRRAARERLMLFRQADLAAIAAGEITVAFRRWKRPMARAGGTLQTPAGLLAFDAVERVDDVTDADARARRPPDADAVRALLRGREGDLYRIRFHVAGPGPADRAARRRRSRRRSARRSPRGSRGWTARAATAPGRRRPCARSPTRRALRAADLAERFGRERLKFKTDVRKLKALGLTESLAVGYRLSPRGRAYLGG